MASNWSPELDVAFFQAVAKYRPIGVHRHFRIINIQRFINTNMGSCVSTQDLWAHLSLFYNLDNLDSRELNSNSNSDDPHPFYSPRDFNLPLDEFLELIEAQRRVGAESPPPAPRLYIHPPELNASESKHPSLLSATTCSSSTLIADAPHSMLSSSSSSTTPSRNASQKSSRRSPSKQPMSKQSTSKSDSSPKATTQKSLSAHKGRAKNSSITRSNSTNTATLSPPSKIQTLANSPSHPTAFSSIRSASGATDCAHSVNSGAYENTGFERPNTNLSPSPPGTPTQLSVLMASAKRGKYLSNNNLLSQPSDGQTVGFDNHYDALDAVELHSDSPIVDGIHAHTTDDDDDDTSAVVMENVIADIAVDESATPSIYDDIDTLMADDATTSIADTTTSTQMDTSTDTTPAIPTNTSTTFPSHIPQRPSGPSKRPASPLLYASFSPRRAYVSRIISGSPSTTASSSVNAGSLGKTAAVSTQKVSPQKTLTAKKALAVSKSSISQKTVSPSKSTMQKTSTSPTKTTSVQKTSFPLPARNTPHPKKPTVVLPQKSLVPQKNQAPPSPSLPSAKRLKTSKSPSKGSSTTTAKKGDPSKPSVSVVDVADTNDLTPIAPLDPTVTSQKRQPTTTQKHTQQTRASTDALTQSGTIPKKKLGRPRKIVHVSVVSSGGSGGGGGDVNAKSGGQARRSRRTMNVHANT